MASQLLSGRLQKPKSKGDTVVHNPRQDRQPRNRWGLNIPVVLKVAVLFVVVSFVFLPFPERPLRAISVVFGLDAVKMVLEREEP